MTPPGIWGLCTKVVGTAILTSMKDNYATSLQVEDLIPLDFFIGYTPAELRQLIPFLETFHYKPGEGPIFSEDMSRKGIQLILEGEVQVIKVVSEEAGIVLATLRRGEIIGEASMFDEGPHTSSVEAVEPTRTIAITKKNYERLVREAPHLGIKIANKAASILSDRLRQANEAVLTYAIWSKSLSQNPPPSSWRWYGPTAAENLTVRDLDAENPEDS